MCSVCVCTVQGHGGPSCSKEVRPRQHLDDTGPVANGLNST